MSLEQLKNHEVTNPRLSESLRNWLNTVMALLSRKADVKEATQPLLADFPIAPLIGGYAEAMSNYYLNANDLDKRAPYRDETIRLQNEIERYIKKHTYQALAELGQPGLTDAHAELLVKLLYNYAPEKASLLFEKARQDKSLTISPTIFAFAAHYSGE